MYSCAFIGHSLCPNSVYKKTKNTIITLVEQHDIKNFYVGTHGNFDGYVYDILCELEKSYDIKINVVLSRLPLENKTAYYDFSKTIFPETVSKTPPKYSIIARNRWMIDQSEFVVFFIEHTASNSVEFARYAKSKKKKMINIGRVDLSKI